MGVTVEVRMKEEGPTPATGGDASFRDRSAAGAEAVGALGRLLVLGWGVFWSLMPAMVGLL